MQTTEHLGVLPEIETREIEEGEQVPMADVEEEVCRALVVAVLEQLGERELEQVLIEGDGRLEVAREESEVMEAARRRRCPLAGRPEVLRPQGSPLLAAIHCGPVSGHGISSSASSRVRSWKGPGRLRSLSAPAPCSSGSTRAAARPGPTRR